jgi:hypothetical protein
MHARLLVWIDRHARQGASVDRQTWIDRHARQGASVQQAIYEHLIPMVATRVAACGREFGVGGCIDRRLHRQTSTK